MEYDHLTVYVLVTDMVNSAANVDIGETNIVIAHSKDEACKHFVKLNPYYIELWKEDEIQEGRKGEYEILSEEEKRKLNEDLLTNDGGIFEVPLKNITGLEKLIEIVKKTV